MVGLFVGVDVSKLRLDVAWSDGRTEQVTNDEGGVGAFVERVRRAEPVLVVMEASGGYERLVLTALREAGVAAVAVNPRQARDFAKAMGRLAKTDRVDARVLCDFATRAQPKVRATREPIVLDLAELVTRRRQLVETISAETTRLKHAPASDHAQRDDADASALDVARVRSLRTITVAEARSLLPEELPGVVLEIPHHLLDVVVDLLVHHERADRALAGLDVLHDRLRVGGGGVGARGELHDVLERLLHLGLLALAASDNAANLRSKMERLLAGNGAPAMRFAP
jgi:transposase